MAFVFNPDSALGADGFVCKFYQFCWDIIGMDVTNVVYHFFRTCSMPCELFSNFLITIPNVVYQIFSSIL